MATTARDHPPAAPTGADFFPAQPPPTTAEAASVESSEYVKKYNKYQANYVRWLKAKYFSKKNFTGGNVFDKEVTMENEVIRTSRWPCTRSFINPVQSLEEQSCLPSSLAETSTTPNRKNLRKTS